MRHQNSNLRTNYGIMLGSVSQCLKNLLKLGVIFYGTQQKQNCSMVILLVELIFTFMLTRGRNWKEDISDLRGHFRFKVI